MSPVRVIIDFAPPMVSHVPICNIFSLFHTLFWVDARIPIFIFCTWFFLYPDNYLRSYIMSRQRLPCELSYRISDNINPYEYNSFSEQQICKLPFLQSVRYIDFSFRYVLWIIDLNIQKQLKNMYPNNVKNLKIIKIKCISIKTKYKLKMNQ